MAWKNQAELLHVRKQVGEQKLLLPHIPCYGIGKCSLFQSRGDGEGQNSAAAAALSHSCKDGTQHHTCCPVVRDCKQQHRGPAGSILPCVQEAQGSDVQATPTGAAWDQSQSSVRCAGVHTATLLSASVLQGTEQCLTLHLIPPRSSRGGSPCGLHGGPLASQRGSRRAPGAGFHLRPGTLRPPPCCQGEGTAAPAPPAAAAQGRGFLTVPGSPPVSLVNGTFDVYQRHLFPSIKASGIIFHHGGASRSLHG